MATTPFTYTSGLQNFIELLGTSTLEGDGEGGDGGKRMEGTGKHFFLYSDPDLNSRGTLSAILDGLFLRISCCFWVKDSVTVC